MLFGNHIRIGRTLPPAAAPIYLRDVLHGISGWSQGVKTREKLEEELRSYFKVRHCFLVSSGKAALTLILLALMEQYPGRDEVLIPAFNCYSVPSAIIRAGLKVTLCDINPATLDFDFEQLTTKLDNPKLLCVVPTHLFGIPADVEMVKNLIGDRTIPVVEDAAQAMDGDWKGAKLGTIGDLGFFSLGRGKAFSTVEGGVILTDNDLLAATLSDKIAGIYEYSLKEIWRLFIYSLALMILMHPSFFWLPKSLPFLKIGETIFDPEFKIRKMSGFQAGLAMNWLNKLNYFESERRSAVREWIRLIPQSFQAVRTNENDVPALLRFPVRIPSEEQIRRLLAEAERMGLGISKTYPDAISEVNELSNCFRDQDFPAARNAARQIITFPVHCYITRHDRERILHLAFQRE